MTAVHRRGQHPLRGIAGRYRYMPRPLPMIAKSTENLPHGLKGRFPFSLSTTSFIFPAGWLENVSRLGAYFDQIELLFFESCHDWSLPDRKLIQSLAQQADELDICYNVHLPIDIRLGAESARQRQHAVDVLKRLFDRLSGMPASTHTLHLVYDAPVRDQQTIDRWQDRTHSSLTRLLEWGVAASSLSIENLDYPLDWVKSTILDLDLTVCLDIGHLLIHGHDVPSALSRWKDRTTVIHLHGVADGKDHLSIDRLSEESLQPVISFLTTYSGVLSLEVFDLEHLTQSMNCLEHHWRALPKGQARFGQNTISEIHRPRKGS